MSLERLQWQRRCLECLYNSAQNPEQGGRLSTPYGSKLPVRRRNHAESNYCYAFSAIDHIAFHGYDFW
jgi:hypothetical protein